MLNDRLNRIAGRIAFCLMAKERPQDQFGGVFFDLRQKIKDLKKDWSEKAKDSLQKALQKDLQDKEYEVISIEMSLGRYRGSYFITSAKLAVKVDSDKKAVELAKDLQKYSLKYTLKNYDKESGIAEYNIR